MNGLGNTGIDEREQWRARISRALTELREQDGAGDGRGHREPQGDESSPDRADL